MEYTLSMRTALEHIKHYVKSKGIRIAKSTDGDSHFDHDTPNTIFINAYTEHGVSASILHEYYHSRQWKRKKSRKSRAIIEYRAETFAIRCCKKLGIIYDKTFVQQYWRDRPDHCVESRYYVTAYGLLIENKVI